SRREEVVYRSLITADEFPALHAVVASGAVAGSDDPSVFGLERILDGVAAYLDADGRGRDRPPTPRQPAELPGVLADKRYREARKAVREAEKLLRAARKVERQTLREARERAARRPAS